MATQVILKDPMTGRIKSIKVGFNWILFLFSPFLGIPLFLNKLTIWGVVFLGLNAVSILTTLSDNDSVDRLSNLVSIIVLALSAWMGWSGNRLIVTTYLEKGWQFTEPESEAVKFAKRKWMLA